MNLFSLSRFVDHTSVNLNIRKFTCQSFDSLGGRDNAQHFNRWILPIPATLDRPSPPSRQLPALGRVRTQHPRANWRVACCSSGSAGPFPRLDKNPDARPRNRESIPAWHRPSQPQPARSAPVRFDVTTVAQSFFAMAFRSGNSAVFRVFGGGIGQ